eukprot:TRINITY_DN1033_c0_g1_i12.p2 TRINITY_DN1033_c0_g1~~TRINITY_DN1033_c0_g1_i12.p2  ORF type:complete len:104 (+),score=4.18 TRINITY_DN1033_c0_g1_i12:327-638(+)
MVLKGKQCLGITQIRKFFSSSLKKNLFFAQFIFEVLEKITKQQKLGDTSFHLVLLSFSGGFRHQQQIVDAIKPSNVIKQFNLDFKVYLLRTFQCISVKQYFME